MWHRGKIVGIDPLRSTATMIRLGGGYGDGSTTFAWSPWFEPFLARAAQDGATVDIYLRGPRAALYNLIIDGAPVRPQGVEFRERCDTKTRSILRGGVP
jgi:hypothetical protein